MEQHAQHIIRFNNIDTDAWLSHIQQLHQQYADDIPSLLIIFEFSNSIQRSDLKPLHLVTFACLIHFLVEKGHHPAIGTSNEDVYDYIYKDLNFSAYWRGKQNHVEPTNSLQIFNLWRIVEFEKDLYAKNAEDYLKRTYFHDKDLSAVSISLVEAFYNVFDHADANGNAFSIIFYDETSHVLSYAIADFGIGIPTSVRNYNPSIGNDADAIFWALQDNATVRSTTRNRGFGMSNILSSACTACVISNHGLITKNQDHYSKHHIETFSFPGTLIYLDIDLSTLEEEEIFDSFTL